MIAGDGDRGPACLSSLRYDAGNTPRIFRRMRKSCRSSCPDSSEELVFAATSFSLAASSSEDITTWRGRLADIEVGLSGDDGSGVGTAAGVRPCGSLKRGGPAGVGSKLEGLDVLGGEGGNRSGKAGLTMSELVRARCRDLSFPLAPAVEEGGWRVLSAF